MKENIKKFMEVVSNDPSYMEKLKEINEKHPEVESNKAEIIKFADSLGITLTEDDFIEENTELSEDELDAVSGGGTKRPMYFFYYSDCICIFGGGGTPDENQKTCACVFAGAGEMTDNGKRLTEKGAYHPASGGVAMWCAIMGNAQM